MFDVYFLAVNFDWSNILIRKSFGASRHISGKLGVKLAITLPLMHVRALVTSPLIQPLQIYNFQHNWSNLLPTLFLTVSRDILDSEILCV